MADQPKSKGSGTRKYNWDVLRNEFVATPSGVSLAEFARDKGMRPDVLHRRASHEGWLLQRAEFWSRTTVESQQKVRNKIIEDEATRLARHVSFLRFCQASAIQRMKANMLPTTTKDLLACMEMERTLLGDGRNQPPEDQQVTPEEAAAILQVLADLKRKGAEGQMDKM